MGDLGLEDRLDNETEDEVDPIVDKVYDERLTKETPEIKDPVQNDPLTSDDEGENDTLSDGEAKSISPSTVSQTTVSGGRGRRRGAKNASNDHHDGQTTTPVSIGHGRGRTAIKAVDSENRPLPKPGSRHVEPIPDYYHKNMKTVKLPEKYYDRRLSPNSRKKRRQSRRAGDRLINFKAIFNEMIVVIDKDDSDEKGFKHACQRLEENTVDLSKIKHDLWHFGLYRYQITFPKPITRDLLDLYPEEINNESNRPYWFTFKRPVKFTDPLMDEKTLVRQTDFGLFLRLEERITADLSYGALKTMSRFYAHPDFVYRKPRGKLWTFLIRNDVLEIQSFEFSNKAGSERAPFIQVKRRIKAELIDRAVIFRLLNDGFLLFINMKGNVHELHRPLDGGDGRFHRQGLNGNKVRPLFSTICLRVFLRTVEEIDKVRSTSTSKSTKEIPPSDQEYRNSLAVTRQLFRSLWEFFSDNGIQVCFGPLATTNVVLDRFASLDSHYFSTFIQNYSWAMLRSMNFRFSVQVYLSREFIEKLQNYSEPLHPEESSDEIDDRFYRLCLYLYRRSSEYFFVDLDKEIGIAIEEYRLKQERLQKRNSEEKQRPTSTSTAHIPSVILTPTTICIKPLKLCKLNRVLREKRFGGRFNFALVELRDEGQRMLFSTVYHDLRDQIKVYLVEGFQLVPDQSFKYLHHSQSQVKAKQFWFYYHDYNSQRLSHADAYLWMGNFDKERVVAKHTARIALCFTSTDKSIRIPAELVTYVRDIKDPTGNYTFSDGVGTISSDLRDKVQKDLHRKHPFSVLQIRYGGCKGTLSINPRLNGQRYQLIIRDSMNKFTCDHDTLEICKLSAPRALYLNRQDIVLLESRGIPHTKFLRLQNKDHLRLIRGLLSPEITYEVLQAKLLPVFRLRRICRQVNVVEEPFFKKLMITCAFNIMREIIDRTRIQIDPKFARNMFGIVDEYGVLEEGQVFVQYSSMREDRLYQDNEKHDEDEEEGEEQTRFASTWERREGKVVITKNPCHHPGDLRIFDAVYHEELRHLCDVVVFPQKGRRPHSNEISGSDLDGDEYVVIWLDDLIPTTPNEVPYDYDSQEEPQKSEHPITRDQIIQVVMDVSEQDCLGTLSNIHLAYVDKEGIKSKTCMDLAGAISQEVDAAKTGKHPLTDEEIQDLREGLKNQWPDFMKTRGTREYYPSERILGKLYRSACRAMSGWTRAIANYGSARQQQLASESYPNDSKMNESLPSNTNQPLDPEIHHPKWEYYLPEIKILYRLYRSELLEIISLYRFQDEIDLFCRGDDADASGGGGSKKNAFEDSAAVEVQNLIERIRHSFSHEFIDRRKKLHCCQESFDEHRGKTRIISCDECYERKLAKAACAYIYTYEKSNRLPAKSNQRILSLPWLFSDFLIQLKFRNRSRNYVDQSDTTVGRAFAKYLATLQAKFKVYLPAPNDTKELLVEFRYRQIEQQRTNLLIGRRQPEKTIERIPILCACFVEVLNDWLEKQKIFGEQCDETAKKPLVPQRLWHELIVHFLSGEYQANVQLSLVAGEMNDSMSQRYTQAIKFEIQQWTEVEYQEFTKIFRQFHLLLVGHVDRTQSTSWAYLQEYLLLSLQCIGIEKELVDQWICPSNKD